MSRDHEPLLPGLDRLGEDLTRAARARAEQPRRSPRRQRKALVAAVAALLLGAAGATAAGIISVGQPAEDKTDSPEQFAPRSERRVVVQAADPGSALGLGVAVYSGRDGQDCVLAGRVRGATLGELDDGRFRPYGPQTIGSCGDLARQPFFAATEPTDGGRTIVYGRAAASVRRLTVRVAEGERVVKPGRGGAFLVVLDGRLAPNELSITAS